MATGRGQYRDDPWTSMATPWQEAIDPPLGGVSKFMLSSLESWCIFSIDLLRN